MSLLTDVRKAVADYMQSEGCSCCRDISQHELDTELLGRLLKVPKYSDGSGYNFDKFATHPVLEENKRKNEK